MAEEYNIQAIMNDLKEKEEMDPDTHDGCYELMRETVSAYAKLDDFAALDYKDLNLIYLTTVGTWKQKIESKKKTVNDSHLMPDDKEHLSGLWDKVWEKAGRGEYTNFELDAAGGRSVGLLGTGFFSFQRTTTDAHAQAFIRMCVDMLPMNEDEEMFGRAAQTLTASFQGMRAASASMVLHCLKPFSFPILNANTGFKNIFEVLGVQLVKPGNIETYIDNSKRIKSFRDINFTCRNYRIYDIESQKLDRFRLKHEYGKFGSWEIVDEDTARLTCDNGLLQTHSVVVPQEICWVFNAAGLHSGIKQEIVLSYDGYEYDGYVEKTTVSPAKTSVFWNDALTEELEEYTEDDLQHVLEFRRDGDARYKLSFVESEPGGRAWLITWNKNNWYWQNFEKKCEATKNGETIVESWACSNSNPKTGDEVFLIKLGDQPRGIIGHGTVARPLYEKSHYDTAKAAEGKTYKAIGVKFDRLLDYEKEKIISQDELKEKCKSQQWSPQNSGIEIRQEVLPALRQMWKAVTGTDSGEDYWPSQEEYPVSLSKEDWKRFIQEIELPKHKGCMRVLACFLDIGGIASPKALSDRYKGHPSVYVGSVVNTGRRAIDYFGMTPCPDGDVQRYFPVAFQGRRGKGDSAGTYEYKMRRELLEALKEMDLSGIELMYDEGGKKDMKDVKFDHNMILYGPPGTGKTYHCAYYAVSICDGRALEEVKKDSYAEVMERFRELKADGRVAFTTFHQSYGYEEFIEGIKPKLNSEEGALGYTIEDGVFKEFCKRAGAVKVRSNDIPGLKSDPHIWGMLLGGTGTTEIKQYCFDNNVIRFGWDHITDTDVMEDNPEASKSDRFAMHQVANFIYSMDIGDIVITAKNITTIDAIGVITGGYEFDQTKKTYNRTRKVKWLVKNVECDIRPFLPNGRKQLPTSYLYPFDYLGIETVSKILDALHESSEVYFETETEPYVFIIDEINRGNISKIFGELITLIEDTKRAGADEAMEAILPYSGEAFSVPDNVYILGTMNTADRSIALMDTALRRRFEFVEMMPDPEVLNSLGVGTVIIGDGELKVARMLEVINERIEYLFDREHTIGHAFFTKLAEDTSIEALAGIFEKNVIPLLQEYFYEDYEKIQLVLGDNAKEDEYKFILDRPIKVKDVFNGNPDIDLPEKGYSVQYEAFMKLESYKQIGKDL